MRGEQLCPAEEYYGQARPRSSLRNVQTSRPAGRPAGESVNQRAHGVGLRVEGDEEREPEPDEARAEPASVDDHVHADADEQGVDRDVLLLPEAVARHVQVAPAEDEIVREVAQTAQHARPPLGHDRVRAGEALELGDDEHHARGADVAEVRVPELREDPARAANHRADEGVREREHAALEAHAQHQAPHRKQAARERGQSSTDTEAARGERCTPTARVNAAQSRRADRYSSAAQEAWPRPRTSRPSPQRTP